MNCRQWVLSKFSDNKLLSNLLFVSIRTLLIFFLHSVGSEFVIIMLVLHVNKIGLDISDIIFERSLMYKGKNNGPIIEPHVTPCLTGSHLEKCFTILFFNNIL
jgi:hypothetical protein